MDILYKGAGHSSEWVGFLELLEMPLYTYGKGIMWSGCFFKFLLSKFGQ